MLRFFHHPDFFQQRQGALLGLRRFPAVNMLQRQADVLAGGQMGIKIKLLEHKSYPAAQLAQGRAG
ncbi:hypothetical protein D3C76_1494390 [compost metagenome]